MNDYWILKSVMAVLPDFEKPQKMDILINSTSGRIENIQPEINITEARIIEDFHGLLAMPGFIDPHVHFRIPGKSEAEDWHTGSLAALSGGVTTVLDMPNNQPALTDEASLDIKLNHIEKNSLVNYGLFGGLTQNNLDFLLNEKRIKAIKVYLASTTGDLLIQDLHGINFSNSNKVFCFHAEDEATIEKNTKTYGILSSPDIHSKIRSEDAAFMASRAVIDLQKTTGGKFHLAHVSTAKEMEILTGSGVSFENAPHHLYCSTDNYKSGGFLWKCNPPLRSPETVNQLQKFLYDEEVQMIATDHAPHLLADKNPELKTPASGIPSLEVGTHFILSEMALNKISYQYATRILSTNAAMRFGIENRGVLKIGNFADITLVNENRPWVFSSENIFSKCGWSPFMNFKFNAKVTATIVNGFIYNINKLKTDYTEKTNQITYRI